MKLIVDRKTDAIYFRLDEMQIVESEEVKPGVVVDYNDQGQVVGIEILHISEQGDIEKLASILESDLLKIARSLIEHAS